MHKLRSVILAIMPIEKWQGKYMPNSSGNIRYCNYSLWPVMFVQGITDDFTERFALMICSFYAPGQGFCVIG